VRVGTTAVAAGEMGLGVVTGAEQAVNKMVTPSRQNTTRFISNLFSTRFP
jgi:hypothetical protein